MSKPAEPSRLFKGIGILMQESFDYLHEAADYHRKRIRVLAVPRFDPDRTRAIYVVRVRGELVPVELEYKLSNILFQARATLDRAMFLASHADPALTWTKGEDVQTSFPIASTEEAWDALVGRKHVVALGAKRIAKLRAIQPFVTGARLPVLLNDLHRFDKHRDPLSLFLIADPQFPMVFDHVQDHPAGPDESWIDFAKPNPPLAAGVELVVRRTKRPMMSIGPEDIPATLAARIDGAFVDVQDLLWDTIEYVSRAADVLEGKRPAVADAFANYFAAERQQLAAFQRGMLNEDWGEWLKLSGPVVDRGASFRRPRSATGPACLQHSKHPRGLY
ncbi:hypothetical protein [Microbacterium sp. 1.5R]|uniref:hypothetical protein n=1 Tax=Microbacterium sp. 1.5R TaxID=1916917 RepID=UPI0012FA7706|nr:hypothetical protein [Microbacterium sp. 1.5R]